MTVTAQLQTTWPGIGNERPSGWRGWQSFALSQPGTAVSEVVQYKTLQRDQPAVGTARSTARTNQEWLADLRGSKQDEALADLRLILLKSLGFALASYGNVRDDDLEDFVQDALLRILAALDTFRGESRFTTWAQKIAVRVALTELRRKRWHDTSLDEMMTGDLGSEIVPRFMADPTAGPEKQAMQMALLKQLELVIAEELTERQRRALIAVYVHGMPLEETARRMGTNRNALYKLLHDARRRLKDRMLARGISAQEMIAFFGADD